MRREATGYGSVNHPLPTSMRIPYPYPGWYRGLRAFTDYQEGTKNWQMTPDSQEPSMLQRDQIEDC